MLTFKHRDLIGWALRFAIVALTFATAYIHTTLGGLMFMANAVSYLGFAALMILPLDVASRYRWLVRAALIGFAAGSIVAWFIFGARYWMAYLDKGIEVGLIALLFVEMFRYDGGPLAVAKRGWQLATGTIHRLTASR
jgi:hypothetical protein